MREKRNWVFSPWLAAAYPVVALLAVNLRMLQPIEAFRSWVILTLLTLVLWLLFGLITRSVVRGGLIAAWWTLLISLYGHIFNLIRDAKVFGFEIGHHSYTLALWIVLGLASVWWIGFRLRDTRPLNTFANVALTVALIFPAGNILWNVIRPGGTTSLSPASNPPQVSLNIPQGETAPDVYYIILDMYTREDVLKNVFQYDNSEFISQLEDLGFYVAECSRSNYHSTELSISSALNMDYYQNLVGNEGSPNLAGWIRQSTVRKAFENAGYTSIALDSGFSPTVVSEADRFYTPDPSVWSMLIDEGANSFEGLMLHNTLGLLIFDLHIKLTPEQQLMLDSAYVKHRERMLYELDTLPQLASQSGPKFVFAHILAPHEPFVFDANGNFAPRDKPFTLNDDKEYTAETYRMGYAGQISYLNQRILSIIKQILQNSDTPPVIIIQGDHGSHRTGLKDGDTPILNAYYLPGNGKDKLYPTISPVNSFRLVLDTYLGADLPLLPDKTYTYGGEPYEFTLTRGICPVEATTPN